MLKMRFRIFATQLLFISAIVLLTSSTVLSQDQDQTQYDKGTPPQHVAGVSDIGSYISTDLGTINLSNGALNFKLPVGQIGGRGFWIPLTLNYNSKMWSARTSSEYIVLFGFTRPYAFAVYDDPDRPIGFAPGWTIEANPSLKARGIGNSPVTNTTTTGCHEFVMMLNKLTLVLPDKGEVQFRDDLTDGKLLNSQVHSASGCRWRDGYRGRRWHATDGSGMIFISDQDDGVSLGNLSGTVITADGTRYRFIDTNPNNYGVLKKNARCTSITDRNGNKITIEYIPQGQYNDSSVIYTDQLGRQTRIDSNVTDTNGDRLAVRIQLPGYNGAVSYYKIKTDVMNLHYRADINPVLPVINGDYDQEGYGYGWSVPHTTLFPNSYGRGAERIDTRPVVTQVILPDSRSLSFAYNEFGEVAEVTMPTGGKVQYDYAYVSTLPSGNSARFEVNPTPPYLGSNVEEIDRAVTTRRTYPDGVNLDATWTYTYSATSGPSSLTINGMTEVKAISGPNILSWQKHYFLDAKQYVNPVHGGTGYILWSTGLVRRSETLNAAGGIINATEQDWTQRAPVYWEGWSDQEQPENDNRVNQTRNYLNTGSFAKTETFYDNFTNARANNVIEIREYDYDQALKRRNVTSYLTVNPDNGFINYSTDDIFLLRLPTQQSVYEGGIEKARAVYQYDKYADDGDNATLTDYGPSVTGRDAAYGPGRTARGNVTAVGSWLDTNGSTLFAYSRYDTLGNVISTKDPRSNVRTISYADNFGAGDNPESGAVGAFGPTFALPTLITSPPPNPGEQQHTAKSQYDFSTGLLTGFKDRNGINAKTEYNDPFNRPTKTISAKGVTGVERQKAMYYAPQTTPYGVTLAKSDTLTAADLNATGDGMLRSWTVTDGFGRTVERWTRQPQGDVKATMIYDGLGRVIKISDLHRNGETPGYTTTTHDLAGRVTSVVTPDNATVSTTYSGNQMTTTDQAGKTRITKNDAFENLIEVTEAPGILNYNTHYSYDVFGNLRLVTQGSQTRTFVYDSFSRLTSATNPESGTVTYAYDPNGNLIEKTDARGVRTTMSYDALNRAKSKVYTGITPEGIAAANATLPANYFYDGYSGLPSGAPSWPGTPSKGKLIGVTYGSGADGTYYKYDSAGRIVTNHQRMATSNYATTYTYNLAGGVTREHRGNRSRNLWTYDDAGRLSSMQTSFNPFLSYVYLVKDISYTSFGALQSETYGNGLIHSMDYNGRQQPTEIMLGKPDNLESVFRLNYIFGTADNVNGQDPEITLAQNNGNIARIKYFISGTLQYSQTFQYDPLNRLRYAVEHNNGTYNDESRAWYQTFDYSRHGSRGINIAYTSDNADAANSALQLADFSEANNRITRADFVYDAAGNLIAEPGKSYTYDGENRLVTAVVVAGGTSQYLYDGSGRRVKKIVGGVATRFEYGVDGLLIAERNESTGAVTKEYFYKSGELLATTKTGTTYEYATADPLGSPRAWTDNSGNLVVGGRHDYMPFGEELFAGYGTRTSGQGYAASAQQDGQRKQFAGYERDAETGQDFAQARYYVGGQGRFSSADPFEPAFELPQSGLITVTSSPQSWNKYSYAYNNPLKYVDEDGRFGHVALGFVVGAVIGGGVEAAKQILNGEKTNWTKIGSSALGGGVTGAIGAATGGVSLLGATIPAVTNGFAKAGITVGASVVGGFIERGFDDDEKTKTFDTADVALDAVFGGFANIGGDLFAGDFLRVQLQKAKALYNSGMKLANSGNAAKMAAGGGRMTTAIAMLDDIEGRRVGMFSFKSASLSEGLGKFGEELGKQKVKPRDKPNDKDKQPETDVNTCGKPGKPPCVVLVF